MPDESEQEPFQRGPKGGRKHTPGRGHDRKSSKRRTDRFRREAKRKRKEAREKAVREWAAWDAIPDHVKPFLPDLRPSTPRPEHE